MEQIATNPAIFYNTLNFNPEYTINNSYYYKIKNQRDLEVNLVQSIFNALEFNNNLDYNIYKSRLLLETFEYLLTNDIKGRYRLMKNVSKLYYNIVINNSNIDYYWSKVVRGLLKLFYHSII